MPTPETQSLLSAAGTIGQLCLADAVATGIKETLITVKYEQQAALAKALGADHIVNIGDTDVREYTKDVTNGIGFDAVIETVGGAENFNTATTIVRKQGAVVLVAGYYKPLEVNLSTIVWSEAFITGSNCYGYSGMETDFEAAIELIDSGKVDATKLVTHHYPLEENSEASVCLPIRPLARLKYMFVKSSLSFADEAPDSSHFYLRFQNLIAIFLFTAMKGFILCKTENIC